jgi:hypothetical protein
MTLLKFTLLALFFFTLNSQTSFSQIKNLDWKLIHFKKLDKKKVQPILVPHITEGTLPENYMDCAFTIFNEAGTNFRI